MEPYEINMTIADSLGRRPSTDGGVCWDHNKQPIVTPPDYHGSLDACVEFEKTLSPFKSEIYSCHLHKIIDPHLINGARPEGNGTPWLAWIGLFSLIHATAAQRCEAYLKTIGKWKEAA